MPILGKRPATPLNKGKSVVDHRDFLRDEIERMQRRAMTNVDPHLTMLLKRIRGRDEESKMEVESRVGSRKKRG